MAVSSSVAEPRNPGVAAVLSLVIPGVGQIYNGDFLRGIFWLIITPGFWIGTAGLFGWPFHLVAAFTAHRRARLKNQGLA
jgi:TM2 domain-containing membrane protein YozV